MTPNARLLLGIAIGYFVMPRLVVEFWGLVDKAKGK